MKFLMVILAWIGAAIALVGDVCALVLYIKGVAKVFSWTKEELSDLSAIFSFLIAVLLSAISFVLFPIALLVGFISTIPFLVRSWVKYVNERRRLILAYAVIPFALICVLLLLKVLVNINADNNSTFVDVYLSLYLSLILTEMFFVYIPPTVIRFVYKPQGFRYIREIVLYMLLSFFATAFIWDLLYESIYFPSTSQICAVYFILSYKNAREESTSKWVSNSIWLFLYFLSAFGSGIRQQTEQSLLVVFISSVLLTALFSPLIIYWMSVLRKIKSLPQEQIFGDNNTNKDEVSGMSDYLVDIGLAHIGRKTKTANPCITPAQTEERQSIERPFLKLLADNYKDEATRKTLTQYFMLYKEMLLFLIYAMVLKKNHVLHIEVKGKLKERMSEGLTQEAIKKRNDYWRELSRTFYESDNRTQDIGHVLEAVFWDKLPKKVKPIPKCGHDSLYAIFCYISKAIDREYQTA